MEERKTPSKPKPTAATVEQLVLHYNKQCGPYNEACRAKFGDDEAKWEDRKLEPFPADYPLEAVIKDNLVERIRRQNHRLGRTVKERSHELLMHKKVDAETGQLETNEDGRTVGYTYQEILDILAFEFPESSTSVACLRWYVTHMRSDADDAGLPWPDMPQVRPRSKAKKAAAVELAEAA